MWCATTISLGCATDKKIRCTIGKISKSRSGCGSGTLFLRLFFVFSRISFYSASCYVLCAEVFDMQPERREGRRPKRREDVGEESGGRPKGGMPEGGGRPKGVEEVDEDEVSGEEKGGEHGEDG
jgi:hypothetical protein